MLIIRIEGGEVPKLIACFDGLYLAAEYQFSVTCSFSVKLNGCVKE